MSRRVLVTSVEVDASSVSRATGIDVETDEQIVFAGDTRLMVDVAQAIDNAEDVEVEIEGWQVLTVK